MRIIYIDSPVSFSDNHESFLKISIEINIYNNILYNELYGFVTKWCNKNYNRKVQDLHIIERKKERKEIEKWIENKNEKQIENYVFMKNMKTYIKNM
jgi:hypothetical protein